MKQCKFCRRTGHRMVEVRTLFGRPDGWKCVHAKACIKRMQSLDQWEGKRVLHRFDHNGTEWTIRHHADDGLRGLTCGPYDSGFVLICEYRQHRTYSWHPTVAKAKDHRDDLVRSWEARTMREYAGGAR